MKDYYKILGISDNASSDEVEKGFQDSFWVAKVLSGGVENMIEAREVLRDPKSRNEYDRKRGKVAIFKPYGVNSGIRFSVFQRPDNSGDGISFVATYPNEDIWGEGDSCSFDDAVKKFCFRRELSRSQWAEQMKYENHTRAVKDFVDAISEFDKGNFEHRITRYFLDFMLNAIGKDDLKKIFNIDVNINDIDTEKSLESIPKHVSYLRPSTVNLAQKDGGYTWEDASLFEKIKFSSFFLWIGFLAIVLIYTIWTSLVPARTTSNCRDTTREIQTITKIDGDVSSVETETIYGCETSDGRFLQAPDW